MHGQFDSLSTLLLSSAQVKRFYIRAYGLHHLEKAQHIHNVFNDSSKDSFLPLRIPLRIPPRQGIGHCGTGHIQNARYWALWHGKRAAFCDTHIQSKKLKGKKLKGRVLDTMDTVARDTYYCSMVTLPHLS